ncbi:kinesin-like protein KIN-8B [Canna indica]|uniref:Kinesin-like protein KIN-8B n=1 Tax=Canna indica TaxID=4628 RepID=A0AAQ3L392_9LILI|nr:kinesin-like protein KIN-8B [Canna indica]
MPSIRAPSSRRTASLLVAVKCRPLTEAEQRRNRHIIQVTDDKSLIVLDPDLSKDYLDLIQNRTKEKRYSFDHVFGPGCTNSDVYRNISSTIAGVIQGLNATVFAYGSTGSGKTYTMVGTRKDPGLMVLSLHTIFDLIKKDNSSDIFEVCCSYLEVYNEVIYDLLEKSSGHLELREDPEHGIIVAGLRSIKVQSADKILELLNLGNSRRKTESTEANVTSSRSHAVLEITVKRKQRKKFKSQILRGKLALVDLAGSERASETNTGGQKLRDGANINRSLLALANCINALGKQQKKGLAYVPYRNSKLTRILKDGLSGNSQTVMVATISPADNQYHHTVNTLKYADRAKEIKTQVHKNIGTVDTHVAEYQRMINNLQVEVCRLRKELAEKEFQLNRKPVGKTADDELSWLNILSLETSENVQERINLQKALFELDETNIRNRAELQHLDGAISMQEAIDKDGAVVQALRSRRQVILDNIRDNDEAGAGYKKDIEINEKHRRQLQDMIDEAISNNGNKTYLHILSQYRLLGIANAELQLEMAMRDQVIHDQREALKKLWNMLLTLGLDEQQILDLAAKQGIKTEYTTPNASFLSMMQSPTASGARISYKPYTSPRSEKYASNDCIVQHHQGCSCVAYMRSPSDSPTVRGEEQHHNSYYLHSHDHSCSAYSGMRENGSAGMLNPRFHTPQKLAQEVYSFCPALSAQSCLCCKAQSSSGKDLQHQPKQETWIASRQNLYEVPPSVLTSGNLNEELASYVGTNCGLHRNHHFCNATLGRPDILKLLPTYATGKEESNSIMAIQSRLLAILLIFFAIGAANAAISSETLASAAPRAITELRDAIAKGLGIQSDDVKVSGFDVRDALVGQAVAYEFDIEVEKKVIPVKLLEDVSRWDFVDLPIFKAAAEEETALAEVGRKPAARVSPVLPPFQLAGPMELWIQDGDDMRLSLPHDVEAGALKKVILSDGAVVTVKGAKSISLRHPIDLPLPLNRSHPKNRPVASGLLTIAEALRHASRTDQKPLLSLRIVGPSSLTSSPSASPNDKLKLKRLAPGHVELSSRSAPIASDEIDGPQRTTLWPFTSIDGSNSNLQGFEELLASVLGKKGSEEGSFRLLKAQMSAQTYVKMSFAVEKGLLDGEVNWSGFPSWKTKPEKAIMHFEVLARVEDNGKVVPERIAEVQPFNSQETVIDSLQTGNVSMSKTQIVHPPPKYFTLD